jgi:hypothetical protein
MMKLVLSTLCIVSAAAACPEGVFIVGDMGDGDYKQITIKGDKFTIVPHGNNQSWTVNSKYDLKSCSASIDFHVPGKPNPPPVKALTLTAFRMINGDHIHVSTLGNRQNLRH